MKTYKLISLFLVMCWSISVPALGQERKYSTWFADSEMARFPEAWQLDHGKRLFFGYAQGVGCCAMLKVWKHTGDTKYYDYVAQWADTVIYDDGNIHK
jgi:unsaturated rhamnogalacturonyl hydrolase